MPEGGTPDPTRRAVLRRSAATGALVGGIAPVGAGAGRQQNCTLDWGRELNAGRCDADGAPVVDVVREVTNGLDTGTCRPWAEDTFRQHIQVWETAGGSFCAVVTYVGAFDAFEGAPSPERCEPLSGEEEGPFEGGLRLSFDGEFAPGGTAPRGSLGTVDQGCSRTTASCDFASATGWIDDYFDDVENLSVSWWGFVYRGGECGTWVNAVDGNCGDVRCGDGERPGR